MKYENLWTFPPANAPNNSTENIAEIMREQIQYLEEGTGGWIKAAFSELTPEYLGKERKDLRDANNFYRPVEYAFDIYNTLYNFRVFYLSLLPFYPVRFRLDDDLMTQVRQSDMEIEYEEHDTGMYGYESEPIEYVIIRSDNALLSLLKRIFSADKVQFMLYKLRQQSEAAAVQQAAT